MMPEHRKKKARRTHCRVRGFMLCSMDVRICSSWAREAIECLQRGLLVACECVCCCFYVSSTFFVSIRIREITKIVCHLLSRDKIWFRYVEINGLRILLEPLH